jgi:hypothetical protein
VIVVNLRQREIDVLDGCCLHLELLLMLLIIIYLTANGAEVGLSSSKRICFIMIRWQKRDHLVVAAKILLKECFIVPQVL